MSYEFITVYLRQFPIELVLLVLGLNVLIGMNGRRWCGEDPAVRWIITRIGWNVVHLTARHTD